MKPRAVKWLGGANQRTLMLAWSNVHLYFWWPRNLPWRSCGMTVRWRSGGGWRHVQLILFQRNERPPGLAWPGRRMFQRKTLTVAELNGWYTEGDTKTRRGTKGYLRLKACLPGREA